MTTSPVRSWLTRLAPAGEVDVRQAALPRTTVDDAVDLLGLGPVQWVIQVSTEVVQRIVTQVPVLGGNAAAVASLHRGNEATTLRALAALAGRAPAVTTADETTPHRYSFS